MAQGINTKCPRESMKICRHRRFPGVLRLDGVLRILSLNSLLTCRCDRRHIQSMSSIRSTRTLKGNCLQSCFWRPIVFEVTCNVPLSRRALSSQSTPRLPFSTHGFAPVVRRTESASRDVCKASMALSLAGKCLATIWEQYKFCRHDLLWKTNSSTTKSNQLIYTTEYTGLWPVSHFPGQLREELIAPSSMHSAR